MGFIHVSDQLLSLDRTFISNPWFGLNGHCVKWFSLFERVGLKFWCDIFSYFFNTLTLFIIFFTLIFFLTVYIFGHFDIFGQC